MSKRQVWDRVRAAGQGAAALLVVSFLSVALLPACGDTSSTAAGDDTPTAQASSGKPPHANRPRTRPGRAPAKAQLATIGGSIWEGATEPDGSPRMDANAPILDAEVMVQQMVSGAFVTYARVSGNSWQAVVPAGEYVAMFSSPDHDCTSRQYLVRPNEVQMQDAYLAPLPLPKAGLMVYTFLDMAVNGEDDFPDDPGLAGVVLRVWDEHGDMVAEGVSGDFAPQHMPDEAPPDPAGSYYFEGLEPGEYLVTADASNAVTPEGQPRKWYLTTSEEGGPAWDVRLYPGDPGTEEGGYLIWFGFVPERGELPPVNGGGTVSGRLLDADGNDPEEPFPYGDYPLVTPNIAAANGLVILSTFGDLPKPAPVATCEADPVTGAFRFENVPPGNYKIISMDLGLTCVWTAVEVSVAPGSHVEVNPLVPRFGSRVQGTVTDVNGNRPVPGATVRIRMKDGNVTARTTTNADGWYNFDFLPEEETIAMVDVELPPGYRGAQLQGDDVPRSTRFVQWWTYNYRANLELERIPAGEGDLQGAVFYDHLARGTWAADGAYDEEDERLFGGIQVNLYNASGVRIAETQTAGLDEAALVAQGWSAPYTYPPDEIGNVFRGALIGHYSFRGLAPGSYRVEVVPPPGFSPSPPGTHEQIVMIQGGQLSQTHFGINTRVPLAGQLEGGVWDDLNIDHDTRSLMHEEKAAIPGVSIGFYDHLGYRVGHGFMGDPLCYPGSTACPPGEDLGQLFLMVRRLAPGPRIFLANDPSLPGFNGNYAPLAEVYTFGQGMLKTEGDWSLMPVAFTGGPAAMTAPANVLASNRPVIEGANRSTAARGDRVRLEGRNFGDAQAYSTVTLAGERLPVLEWSDHRVEFRVPQGAVSGVLLVATSTGISNARSLSVKSGRSGVGGPGGSAVYVDSGHVGAQAGTQAQPFRTLGQALANLPAERPRRVFVAPGTYRERIQIQESDVHLLGSGPQTTILDGLPESIPMPGDGQGVRGAGPVIFIGGGGTDGSVQNVRIAGLTITGGTVRHSIGAGIFSDYGNRNVDINTCIIQRNGGYYGGGIWLHNSNHDILMHSNTIAENGNYGGYGGGISVNDEPEYGEDEHGEPEHVVDDLLMEPQPGVYEITNNVIFHNYSADYGAALCLYESKDHLIVYGNMIVENKAEDHGGAFFFEDTGPIDIFGNTFLRNFCYDDGAAISFEDVTDMNAVVRIYNNLFAENIADDRGENRARGGALAFDDTFHAEVVSNTIVSNVVAGAFSPAGGGIDAERNGHEYAMEGDGTYVAPGFSNPKIVGNIVWDNWRLQYDQPAPETEEDLDYTWGRHYRWSADELHVDNPALQGEWQTWANSESFSEVHHNVIRGGYGPGPGGHNVNWDIDPGFVDPERFDWRLRRDSPVRDLIPAEVAPPFDLELLRRFHRGGVGPGAYEFHAARPTILRIPEGILGAVEMP